MTQWEQATGGTSAAVKTVLLDYTKTFDSIDHRILFQQMLRLDILYEVQYWVRDFLTDKYRRITISNDCYFDWGNVPLCVTQGTKLGSLLFVIIINDREVGDSLIWKFVDDISTASETVPKDNASQIQKEFNDIET